MLRVGDWVWYHRGNNDIRFCKIIEIEQIDANYCRVWGNWTTIKMLPKTIQDANNIILSKGKGTYQSCLSIINVLNFK